MFAFYAKIRKMLEVYERGLAEFDPRTQPVREKWSKFPRSGRVLPRRGTRTVIRFFAQEQRGLNMSIYANSVSPGLARARGPGSAERAPRACEAYTCLAARHADFRSSTSTTGTDRSSWLRLENQYAATFARISRPRCSQ